MSGFQLLHHAVYSTVKRAEDLKSQQNIHLLKIKLSTFLQSVETPTFHHLRLLTGMPNNFTQGKQVQLPIWIKKKSLGY